MRARLLLLVALIATPPEETRNWADADKVVPNAVPPGETVSRPPPPDVSLPTRDAEIDVPLERNRLPPSLTVGSIASSVLRPHPTSHPRTCSAYGFCLPEPARHESGHG